MVINKNIADGPNFQGSRYFESYFFCGEEAKPRQVTVKDSRALVSTREPSKLDSDPLLCPQFLSTPQLFAEICLLSL